MTNGYGYTISIIIHSAGLLIIGLYAAIFLDNIVKRL